VDPIVRIPGWRAFVDATAHERGPVREARPIGNRLSFETSTALLTTHVRCIDRAMRSADELVATQRLRERA
jgi:hypothetical protein